MQVKQSAIIIGSGIAGLACAVRLAVQGFEVTVFEKNNHPGGKLYAFGKDGYRFDTGPSLFIQPGNIEALFKLADENIHEYLSYKSVDISCTYFYEDGIAIHAYTEPAKLADEIQQKTGEPAQHIISYLQESENIYNNIGKLFLNESIHTTKAWKKKNILKALLSTKPGYIFSTLHAINKKHFSSPHVIQLFDRYATYNGSNPYKAPGMLMLIPQLELNKGVFYPEGGMMAINNALYKLALKKGVMFHFNTEVQRIVETNNKATGITANNESFFADVIVSNADVYFTYLKLLNDKAKAEKILNQERSSSTIVFYWGIKQEFKQLALHNIFFSKDYKAEFSSIFKTKKPYADPTIYINITSKAEAGIHAPAGKENWFVMINVPADVSISKEAAISLYKKNSIAKLNRMLKTDVENLIETESILHPKKIETDTGSYAGAIYGTSSNARQAAFLRHPNFSKNIQGLYFAGGTVHPGGGIPLCFKSAEITSNLIEKYFQKK